MRAPMRPRFNELLDAGIAHAHQGEFGCREEGIGRHQEKDQKDPEQHKGDHGSVILTFERQLLVAGMLTLPQDLHGWATAPLDSHE